MNDISVKIELYHNLFQTSLILALLFLAIAGTLFFMLDIRATLGYLTGRHAKKMIKELEAATAVSVRLTQKQHRNMHFISQEVKQENEITAVLESGTSSQGKFAIIRELMLIHTEETM